MLDLYGEPAGTRTQDHLIKSFPLRVFSFAKSMMKVPNCRAGHALKSGAKVGIGNYYKSRSLIVEVILSINDSNS
jgi:hypothetical protein